MKKGLAGLVLGLFAAATAHAGKIESTEPLNPRIAAPLTKICDLVNSSEPAKNGVACLSAKGVKGRLDVYWTDGEFVCIKYVNNDTTLTDANYDGWLNSSLSGKTYTVLPNDNSGQYMTEKRRFCINFMKLLGIKLVYPTEAQWRNLQSEFERDVQSIGLNPHLCIKSSQELLDPSEVESHKTRFYVFTPATSSSTYQTSSSQ